MAGLGWDRLGSAVVLDLCWACKSSAWTETKTLKAYIRCLSTLQYRGEYVESSVPVLVHNIQYAIHYAP
ncbi:hypothetical protein V8C43DRAFT_299133 [Trichoderma afarasin]